MLLPAKLRKIEGRAKEFRLFFYIFVKTKFCLFPVLSLCFDGALGDRVRIEGAMRAV